MHVHMLLLVSTGWAYVSDGVVLLEYQQYFLECSRLLGYKIFAAAQCVFSCNVVLQHSRWLDHGMIYNGVISTTTNALAGTAS